MRKATTLVLLSLAALLLGGCPAKDDAKQRIADAEACAELLKGGLLKVADERDARFLGKVEEATARCRGGQKAVDNRDVPWVDWQNYWGAGDANTQGEPLLGVLDHLTPDGRGVDGSLLDLEYQRIELVKFNLVDNSGTFDEYVTGRGGSDGAALKVWDEMRLPPENPSYAAVGGDGEQLCQGELIRFRTNSGICNDIRNPLMGATGTLFPRNVELDSTFPRLGKTELARNRHGDRIGLLKPDPQVISRRLFTRAQSQPDKCNDGQGLPDWSAEANCDYQKAPFFNVLAAFWIQFMTHDWFSHLEEGHNQPEYMEVGCKNKMVDGQEVALTPEEIAELGCRPGDRMEKAFIAEEGDPPTFSHGGREYPNRAYKTTRNNVTAWWDASQIYGYDEVSLRRVKRDPNDGAKLHMVPVGDRSGAGEAQGYLPIFDASAPINPAWAGQEVSAFPDNWTIGMSFYHNVFSREHNAFVDVFRARAAENPDADSGLRNPAAPDQVIAMKDVSDDELFEAGRFVVSAMIAKIHTIEWTTQLLYDEPLFGAMNANWDGLFADNPVVEKALSQIVTQSFGASDDAKKANTWYSVFASGPGILGLGSYIYEDDGVFAKFSKDKTDIWSIANPDHVNGGINHFGSPFNFPEEFPTVYRLHPLVPDLIEYREWDDDPNAIKKKVPVVQTFRGTASQAMHGMGLANFALSMGRQRLGLLTLQNHGLFLQNLTMKRLQSPTQKIDVAALDVLRDRERGVPRFNEFRRQYGLQQLTSFDDFVNRNADEATRAEQTRIAGVLREIYGQHTCDASLIISTSQKQNDAPVNDCLGHPDGSVVDNVEDVDTVVGWLAEFPRPHGFAISETQFHVFILNASRRLFSDRFFTSSFRPEFYTHLGVEWVNDNGPDGKVMEKGKPNGHEMEMAPMKRVLLRVTPELAPELDSVVNTFDAWARDRGEYYTLDWKPRPGAESDPAFHGGGD